MYIPSDSEPLHIYECGMRVSELITNLQGALVELFCVFAYYFPAYIEDNTNQVYWVLQCKLYVYKIDMFT